MAITRLLKLSCGTAGALALSVAVASAQVCPPPERQPITEDLIALVDGDPGLRDSLARSIALGQVINDDPNSNPVASLDDYYDFIDALVTYNPQNIDTGRDRGGFRIGMAGDDYCLWNILDIISYSYFLVDRQITTDPRGQIQFENASFATWMRGVSDAWGAYLETPASAVHVPDFTDDPLFGDWYCPPLGGYATFQDFFTRELCPATFPTGSRPVAGLDDPRTVASVADSGPAGHWPISRDGRLVTAYDNVSQAGVLIKGILYNDIPEFITGRDGETVLAGFGEIDAERFNGGTFTHQFLNVNNYHRLHLPVGGELVYMRHFQAANRLKSNWRAPLFGEVGYYDPEDTPDWQFGQTRLVLGIDTREFGVVIAAPMGMAQVAAIQLRDWVEEGAPAEKGWEFANFAFGGSDFVVLFEDQADFRLTVDPAPEPSPGYGVNYRPVEQGERYGCLGGVTDCSAERTLPRPYPGLE